MELTCGALRVLSNVFPKNKSEVELLITDTIYCIHWIVRVRIYPSIQVTLQGRVTIRLQLATLCFNHKQQVGYPVTKLQITLNPSAKCVTSAAYNFDKLSITSYEPFSICTNNLFVVCINDPWISYCNSTLQSIRQPRHDVSKEDCDCWGRREPSEDRSQKVLQRMTKTV